MSTPEDVVFDGEGSCVTVRAPNGATCTISLEQMLNTDSAIRELKALYRFAFRRGYRAAVTHSQPDGE